MNLERTTMINTDSVIKRPECKPLTLIERLENERNTYRDYCHLDDMKACYETIDDCIDIVKEHSGWVSVDERLPSENELVLIYKQKIHLIGIARYLGNNFWRFATQSSDPTNTYVGLVSHWCEIPQPPSEVNDDVN